MKLVLDYGNEHPSCNEIVPPSPNSSSDSLQRQAEIAQAHLNFQLGSPVVVGPVRPTVEPVPVHPGFGPPSPGPDDEVDNDDDAPAVDPVDAEPIPAEPVLVEPAPTGPVTDESIASSELSEVLPADNPAPGTVAGGHSPVEAFIEFGTIHFPPSAKDWYRFSSSPTQFKLVSGADGREFLFCMPNADEVDITRAERTGYRDVSFQVRPSTCAISSQTDPLTPPVSPPGTPPGTPPNSDPGSSEQGDVSSSGADSNATPSDGASLSSGALAEKNQELLASAELAK